ncbi:hypothetical protein JB92DRAFT_2975546 [Gautieria morchelliformis]|nr:hypothetical protein JB92DRAFT_2975546 [Gautieria morchelliformis]
MGMGGRPWTAPHNGAGIEVPAVQWIPISSAAPELYGLCVPLHLPPSTMGTVLAREQCRRSGGARLARRLACGVCWIASITDAMELGLGIAISVIVGPCVVSASTSRGGVRLPRRLAWPWQAQGRLAIYSSFPY